MMNHKIEFTQAKRGQLFSLLLISIVMICIGCRTTDMKPGNNFDTNAFIGAYTNNWPLQEVRLENQLVHLGMPDTNRVVIWYALPEKNVSQPTVDVIIKRGEHTLEGKPVRHFFNPQFRTGRYEISDLQPDTSYDLSVSLGTQESVRLTAKTTPVKSDQFSFIVTSCFQPYYWNQSVKAKDSYISNETVESLRAFRNRATHIGGPSFVLGLGDQLYTDPGSNEGASISLLGGKHSEKLKCPIDQVDDALSVMYRAHFALEPMNATLTSIPMAMMWDDHDISDGWGSQGYEKGEVATNYFRSARGAFEAYQLARNPTIDGLQIQSEWKTIRNDDPKTRYSMRTNSEAFFTFDWGNASFFVTDTRSEKNYKIKRSMSDGQIESIENWLKTNADQKPKVLVFCFSVPLLQDSPKIKRLRSSALVGELADDWRDRATFSKKEREKVLSLLFTHMRKHPNQLLLVLSGDVHYGGIQVLKDYEKGSKNPRIVGYEIVSSGLAQTKFNDLGGYWNSISKNYPKISDPEGKSFKSFQPENHGIYVGPNFSEIFIGKTSTGMPEVKMMMYGVTKSCDTVVRLDVSKISYETAFRPESAPENSKRGYSQLYDYLFRTVWAGAQIDTGKHPKERATSW